VCFSGDHFFSADELAQILDEHKAEIEKEVKNDFYNLPMLIKYTSLLKSTYCLLLFMKIGANPGICERRGRSLPLSSSPLLSLSPLSPFPLPLRSRPFKPARGSGERCKLPQSGPGHSHGRKRIRCTLKLSESHCMVAIILHILSTMFYSRTIKILHLLT